MQYWGDAAGQGEKWNLQYKLMKYWGDAAEQDEKWNLQHKLDAV